MSEVATALVAEDFCADAIGITLLVAIGAVVLGSSVGRWIPALAESGLHQVTISAWVAGLLSWGCAMAVAQRASKRASKEKGGKKGTQSHGGNGRPRAIGLTVTVLALATAAVFALQRFGDQLIG